MINSYRERFIIKRDVRSSEYAAVLDFIVKKDIDTVSSSKNPKIIFATAQPGAGKTVLTKKIIQDFGNESFVVIDIDDYRCFHPDFDMLKDYKDDVIPVTNTFIFDLEEDILLEVIKKHKSVIYVTTLRDTDFICNFIINKAKKENYSIGFYLLAVPLVESLLSSMERYENQIENKSPLVHFVDYQFHNLATKGFEDTLSYIEKNSLGDFFNIHIRGKVRDSIPLFIESVNHNIVESIQKIRNDIVLDKQNLLQRFYKIQEKQSISPLSDTEIPTMEFLFDLIKQI